MKSLAVELNRLAGTTGLSTIAAANAYAGNTSRPYWSLWEALNQKAGNAKGSYVSINKVLNQLAGTTGLSNIRAAESISGVVALTYVQEVLADSPIGYWRLGETSGTNANDETSNNYDGTYSATYTLGQPGPVAGGKSVSFAGTGYVTLGSPALLKRSHPISVEAWIYPTAWAAQVNEYTLITEAYGGDGNVRWMLGRPSGGSGVGFGYYTPGPDWSNVVRDPSDPPLDTWTHYVGTYDGANMYLYKNGVEVATRPNTAALPNGNETFYIGRNWAGATYFPGRMAEAAVYGSALSPTRIAAHYAARSV